MVKMVVLVYHDFQKLTIIGPGLTISYCPYFLFGADVSCVGSFRANTTSAEVDEDNLPFSEMVLKFAEKVSEMAKNPLGRNLPTKILSYC